MGDRVVSQTSKPGLSKGKIKLVKGDHSEPAQRSPKAVPLLKLRGPVGKEMTANPNGFYFVGGQHF